MHAPGSPPQWPHMPGAGADDFGAAELTAKTLIERAVRFEPQLGHATFSPSASLDIFLTSFSNFDSHFRQVYS